MNRVKSFLQKWLCLGIPKDIQQNKFDETEAKQIEAKQIEKDLQDFFARRDRVYKNGKILKCVSVQTHRYNHLGVKMNNLYPDLSDFQ